MIFEHIQFKSFPSHVFTTTSSICAYSFIDLQWRGRPLFIVIFREISFSRESIWKGKSRIRPDIHIKFQPLSSWSHNWKVYWTSVASGLSAASHAWLRADDTSLASSSTLQSGDSTRCSKFSARDSTIDFWFAFASSNFIEIAYKEEAFGKNAWS